MLGHAEERDYVPDAVTDDLVLVGCAQHAESPSRDLAHESALAAWGIDEASAAAKSSSRAKRRASTPLPKTPMPRIPDRRVAVNGATPRSRVERSLEAAADRARVLRTPRRPLRHELLLDFVASGPALAVWFIVAATAWWLLPKSWDGGDAVARRRLAPSNAASFVSPSELLNNVAAARLSREELLRLAEADPLSVQAYKRIDEIREGDLVVALDEDSGELVARPVTRLFRNTSDHLREVAYQTADGAERRLETTDEHPFWTARDGWTPARDLQQGDEFRQADGDDATLLATLYVEEPDGVAVYNFEVDGAHNYFVAAPNTLRGPPGGFFATTPYAGTLLADSVFGDAVLVYNKCGPGDWKRVNEAMSDRAREYQRYITKRAGQSYIVNGVKFDGFKRGVLLEAKGPGYKNFIKDGDFREWFKKGRDSLFTQAQRQLAAANGVPIQWHVAEKELVAALQQLFKKNNVSGISIILSPLAR